MNSSKKGLLIDYAVQPCALTPTQEAEVLCHPCWNFPSLFLSLEVTALVVRTFTARKSPFSL